MTDDAPEQIGEGTVSKSYESHAARVTISGTEYIRADHAQAEKEAAVDAAYEDAACVADQMEEEAFELGDVDPLGEEYWPSCVGGAIRARRPPPGGWP